MQIIAGVEFKMSKTSDIYGWEYYICSYCDSKTLNEDCMCDDCHNKESLKVQKVK